MDGLKEVVSRRGKSSDIFSPSLSAIVVDFRRKLKVGARFRKRWMAGPRIVPEPILILLNRTDH
jgi:hypothetical protein